MRYSRSDAKGWVRDTLRGYLVTVTTPFDTDLELNEAGLRDNVERLLALPGANGLYVGSIYQEFWTLTHAERMRVADIVLEANAGRVPTIVGVSHTCLKDTIELARHAEAAGADLIMCWPPYYGPRSREGVRAFYSRLAESVSIGIGVYSSTLSELGHYIDPVALSDLADIDTICAVKEASLSLDKYSDMMAAVGHRLAVSCPLEEYHLYGASAFPEILPRFLFGSSRPLYMQTAERPHCADFMKAIEAGDLAAARTALARILKVSNQLHSRFLSRGHHAVALTKHLTSLVGLAAGPVRPPLSAPSADEIAWAESVLLEEGLLRTPRRAAA